MGDGVARARQSPTAPQRFPRSPGLPNATSPHQAFPLEALLAVGAPAEPPGFAAFWRGLHAETLRVPPSPRLTWRKDLGAHRLFEVRFSGLEGGHLGGWLALPRAFPAAKAVLVAHGYGGCSEPDAATLRSEGDARTAVFFPCARGFGLSADGVTPGDSVRHVVHGLESSATYSHKLAVADLWAAVSALQEAAPTARGKLFLHGTSFGGGIGTMALAWDRRIARAFLEVPSFGNHPLRLQLPTEGSGQSVQAYLARSDHPERLREVLSFFDAAVAARHVRAPTQVAAALKDPAVTPPGQFSIYNALPGPKGLFVLSQGHGPLPGDEAQRLERARRRWLALGQSEDRGP